MHEQVRSAFRRLVMVTGGRTTYEMNRREINEAADELAEAIEEEQQPEDPAADDGADGGAGGDDEAKSKGPENADDGAPTKA